jgi:hypothetical protein
MKKITKKEETSDKLPETTASNQQENYLAIINMANGPWKNAIKSMLFYLLQPILLPILILISKITKKVIRI